MAVTSASSSSGPSENDNHANGIPAAEPGPALPPPTDPQGRDTRIVRAAIHPAIGVARVGDSADEFFLGPETESPL